MDKTFEYMANNKENPLLGDGATVPFSRTPIEESLPPKPVVTDVAPEGERTVFFDVGSAHSGKRSQRPRCLRRGPRGKRV